MKRLSQDSILLCGKGRCCPVITRIDDDNYEVKDDDGNIIRVKKTELDMIADAMQELDDDNRDVICG